jgi:(p)ppGpp synthase/HD superfamily hydrolase
MTKPPILTARYTAAVDRARILHSEVRKGTTIPYLSHLLSVSALVLEHGGTEDHAIAALLHDAAEDHGGHRMLDIIRAEFGDVVADIVAACSDSLVEDAAAKDPWWDRKREYLLHLEHSPEEAVLVSGADKLHNARAVLADYRRVGERLWERFNPDAGWLGSCWYYGRLAEVLGGRLEPLGDDARALAAELRRTVEAIHTEVGAAHPDFAERLAAIAH